MRTLRSRIAIVLLIGNGLLVVVAGWTLRTTVFHWLQAEFDRALLAKANALVTLTKEEEGEVELDFADEFMPEFEAKVDPEYFQIWIRGDQVLERSRSLDPKDLPRDLDVADQARFRNLKLEDGRLGRAVQVDYGVQREGTEEDDLGFLPPTQIREGTGHTLATIVVARSVEDLLALKRTFDFYLLATVGLLMVLLGLLAWFALRWGLTPLDKIAAQVGALDAESLDERIDIDEPPIELAPIVSQLNLLLQRLRDAFARERQLSSDMAHELRTPIAELRALSEVNLAGDPGEEHVTFYRDVREIALQMERVVAQLLQLARSEGKIEAFESRAVEIAPLIESAWSHHEARARSRGMELRFEGDRSTALMTDPDQLNLVLSNLVSNAVTHGVEHHPIVCRVEKDGGTARLILANRSSDLDLDDLDRLFDRFWRKEKARSGGLHVGLGMALARAVAGQLGLEIELSLDDDIFQVSLQGPAAL